LIRTQIVFGVHSVGIGADSISDSGVGTGLLLK
jgi:hypothetical protein